MRLLRMAFLLSLAATASTTLAAEKDEPGPPAPPSVAITLPLAARAGVTNAIRIRGLHLTNVTALRFTNSADGIEVSLGANEKVNVPKESDAKKTGDAQIEASIFFPPGEMPATHWFVLENPLGISAPHPLVVLPGEGAREEQEPNGGFKQAQLLPPAQPLLGRISEPGDVDVFRFEAREGESVRAAIIGNRHGSLLDALMTLYTNDGQIVCSNDDSEFGIDALLETRLPRGGPYLLSVIDAHGRGGPLYVYLLTIEIK